MTEKKQAAEFAKIIGREKGKKKTSSEDKLSYDIKLQTLQRQQALLTTEQYFLGFILYLLLVFIPNRTIWYVSVAYFSCFGET